MRNIRLRLQYEGTRYQGWQKQTSTDNTIQGKMETLLTKMCGEPIEISASGRTDAGVHALGQVANFHTEAAMSVEEILEYCNRYLPEDIAVNRSGENTELTIRGRHDPIIVPRAVVVMECMTAITVLDAMMMNMSAKLESLVEFYQ